MHNKLLHTCRICGYFDKDLMPWGEDGDIPSFEICPCCGVEFGYEDVQIDSIVRYRKKWMNSKKFLLDPKYIKQLENISSIYFVNQ